MSSGVPLAARSYCPFEDPDPSVGIQDPVLRDGFVPEEAISVNDALKTYTINAAYAAFEEDVRESIEEGKLADTIILDKNPLDVPKDRLKDIQVLETIIRGKTVYTHNLSTHLDLRFGGISNFLRIISILFAFLFSFSSIKMDISNYQNYKQNNRR